MNKEMDKLYIDNSNFKEFSKYNNVSFRDRLTKRVNKLKQVLESLEEREVLIKQHLTFRSEDVDNLIEAITGTIATLEAITQNEEYMERVTMPNRMNEELNKDYDNDGKTNREELRDGTNPYLKDENKGKKELELER